MTIKDLMKRLPNRGSRTVKELSKQLGSSEEKVRKMLLMLAQQGLVEVKEDVATVTKRFIEDRKACILPQFEKPADEPSKMACDFGVGLKADPLKVFGYLVLFWGNDRNELEHQFNLSGRELEAVLDALERNGFVKVVRRSGFLGLFGGIDRIDILDCSAEEDFRGRFCSAVFEDDYRQLYRTHIDVLVDLVEEYGSLPLSKIAKFLNTSAETLLPIVEILASKKMIELRHKGPNSVLFANEASLQNIRAPVGSALLRECLRYEVVKGDVRVAAILAEKRGEDRYMLCYPEFFPPTRAVLDRLYDLVDAGAVGEVRDLDDYEFLKGSLRANISAIVRERLGFIDVGVQAVMVAELSNELHLGRLEYLLKDPYLEEINIKSGRPVFVKHVRSRQEWVETNVRVSDGSLLRYVQAMARQTRQQVDSSHPLMDAVLHTRDRVNVTMPESASGSILVSIRVFSKMPWNFVRVIKKGTVSAEAMALLWMAIEHKLNILLTGETGCGKTSFLNAICLFIPRNIHIVSVEDTQELRLPESYKNWSTLTTKRGGEGLKVTMNMLLEQSLRMNPDRLLIGEVRSNEDILTLMRATAMGHPVLATIHAADCETVVKRFVDAQASLNDIKHINLAVVLQGIKAKNDKTSIRKRVREVGEFHLTSTGKINSNRLYTYLPDEDKTVRVNEPEELFSALMKNVAMNKDEIVAEIGKKKSIIDWLVRCDTEDIEVLGQIIQAYYKNPERIEQAAQTMLNPMEVIGDDVCWVEPSGAEVE